jgi:hypothetical protein
MKPSHPTFIKASNGQWQGITKPSSIERSGITAAGTVADSYRIPFSLQRMLVIRCNTKTLQIYTIYLKSKERLNSLNMNRC